MAEVEVTPAAEVAAEEPVKDSPTKDPSELKRKLHEDEATPEKKQKKEETITNGKEQEEENGKDEEKEEEDEEEKGEDDEVEEEDEEGDGEEDDDVDEEEVDEEGDEEEGEGEEDEAAWVTIYPVYPTNDNFISCLQYFGAMRGVPLVGINLKLRFSALVSIDQGRREGGCILHPYRASTAARNGGVEQFQ